MAANFKCVLLIMLIFWTRIGFSQTIAVQLDNQTFVYLDRDNPLTLVVEGYKCKDLVLTADNGSVASIDDKGHYLIRPDHGGAIILKIFDKANSVIGEKHFIAKCPDIPVAGILHKHGGNLSADYVHKSIGPVLWLKGYEFEPPYSVLAFRIIVTRNSKIILDVKMHSDKRVIFSDDPIVLQTIQTLQPGDRVQLEDIFITGSAECNLVEPVDVTIVD